MQTTTGKKSTCKLHQMVSELVNALDVLSINVRMVKTLWLKMSGVYFI